jgi:hypothetical protein
MVTRAHIVTRATQKTRSLEEERTTKGIRANATFMWGVCSLRRRSYMVTVIAWPGVGRATIIRTQPHVRSNGEILPVVRGQVHETAKTSLGKVWARVLHIECKVVKPPLP